MFIKGAHIPRYQQIYCFWIVAKMLQRQYKKIGPTNINNILIKHHITPIECSEHKDLNLLT